MTVCPGTDGLPADQSAFVVAFRAATRVGIGEGASIVNVYHQHNLVSMVSTSIHVLTIVKHISIVACITTTESIDFVTFVFSRTNIELSHVCTVVHSTTGSYDILIRGTALCCSAFVHLLYKEMTPFGIFIGEFRICLEIGSHNSFLFVRESIRNNPSTVCFGIISRG